jgi:enoyl-CoA hydratase/carnithine racemase
MGEVLGTVGIDRSDLATHAILNRPEAANALNFEMLTSLVDVIAAEADSGTRALVLSGSGGGFSAGADFNDLTGGGEDRGFDDAVALAARALTEAPFPVIAAVEGFAFGAGVDLAWSCDAVVLSEDARVGVPSTHLGILYNPESLALLHSRIGDRAWRRIVLLGDELDGTTAFSLGMGETLAPPGRAVAEAMRLASKAAAGTREAVAATKGFSRAIMERTADDPGWQALRMDLLDNPERREAVLERQRRTKGS